MSLPKIEKCLCKYAFTDEEKKDIAQEMAQAVTEKTDLDDDFKAIKDDFKARISRAEAVTNSCATKLNNGYEMRNLECEVLMDFDRKITTWRRIDTGEITKSRPMTSDELQGDLPLN